MRKDTPAILINGLGGVGKTTLARGFLKWLDDTEGMDACFWFKFIDTRSAEYVINAIGSGLFGKDFLAAGMEEKIEALAHVLKENRIVIVWDNFEVVAGIPGTYQKATLSEEDRGLLLALLKKIRGGVGKVIITSRSEEKWLGIQRLKVSIGGLIGEERWEYCDNILDNLGISINREDPDLVELMKLLEGHPLAMQVILPKLEDMSVRQVIEALLTNMEALGSDAEKLFATLRFAEEQLPHELKPLLIPLALHEQFIQAEMLELMAKQIDEGWTREKIDSFLEALSSAGLLTNVSGALYGLHPALTGFLRQTLLETISGDIYDRWSRAFVNIMGSLADELTPRPLHETRTAYHIHGANFHFALAEAERLEMHTHQRALIQSLAAFAQNTLNFPEARELYTRLSELNAASGHEEGEAAAYHQLGIIAQEQRDFENAEKWYLKSLKIDERLGNEAGAAITYHQLGRIAEEQRDFENAEKWYLKSLKIDEKLGNEAGAASTYHQLGMISQEQRDFENAEKWYLKSLGIKERLGNEAGAAITYHQLGIIAQEQRDFENAEKWYLKSLEIEERLGNEAGAAITYHQLGMISQEQRDFENAEKWYLKSLGIKERLGNEAGAATTYHQLGIIAEEQRDFENAEKWYLKSLEIKEMLRDEHGAASTYGQLGILRGIQEKHQESGAWFLKAVIAFHHTNDPGRLRNAANNFIITFQYAPAEDKVKLKAMWEEAGLGPFPNVPEGEGT